MGKTTVCTVSGIVFLGVGLMVGWYVFPRVFHEKIKEAKQLRKGSEMRTMWTKLPIALDFRIRVYNVTNPEEVTAGKTAVVQEVGPFVYDEWKEKVNLVDDPVEDTITYNCKNTFYFNQEMSAPLTGEEIVTVPHMVILTMVTMVMEEKPGAIKVVDKAIPQLFNEPTTPFLTVKVKDLLFEGVPINCTKSKVFAANAICDEIRKDPKGLKIVDENTILFSVMGSVNGTEDPNTLTVKRGMQNVSDVGEVVMWKGKSEQGIWNGPLCNRIKGTDNTIFAPFMEKTELVWAFGFEVCRSMAIHYIRDEDYQGIHGWVYTADWGDMANDPELQCYCKKNDASSCLKKGAFDATKCLGAPMIITMPHCLFCHPEYANAVRGYAADEKLHGIISIFEPVTGTPVSGHKRSQFNMFMTRVDKVTLMKNLSEEPVLMPLFWVDEGADLNTTFTNRIKLQLYTVVKIVHIVRMLLVIMGVLMIVLAILLGYRHTKMNPQNTTDDDGKTTITQVSPAY